MGPEVNPILTILLYLIFAGIAFSLCLLLVGGVGFIIAYLIRNRPGVDERHPWATLAKANNLTFIPGFFGYFESGSRITGEYRGYELILEFIAYKNSDTTKLTLFENDNITTHHLPAVYEIMAHQPVSFDDIINLLTPNGLPANLKGVIYVFYDGVGICYEQAGRETDIAYLQVVFDLVGDIADAYPKILSIGGEAVPILEAIAKSNDPLRSVAWSLLKSIGKETAKRLGSESSRLLCPHCFVYYAVHTVPFFWRSISYYGCRICGQSNDYIDFAGPIVAVLDAKQGLKQWEQAGKLWVNWFAHGELFDFDQVEITQATDEEVERFAVQVGNDTDPIRKPRYKDMYCEVSSSCQLSENSIRILRKTFGQVGEEVLERLEM